METSGLEIFMWYCAGILSYMLVSKLLNYGSIYNLYNSAVVSILQMLYVVDEEVRIANKYSFNIAKSQGATDLEAQIIIEASDRANEVWRDNTIQMIILMTPDKLRPGLKFKNWNQAMSLVEKHSKR